ncbi:Cep164 [Symbiodinium natans]|uniref:Cep164 protein n=1 Tax=Symbiodinium natans TaxID=878477 RepID=A0A812GHH2_9DINO|nr:Cep164 [Symbiodinium natans]
MDVESGVRVLAERPADDFEPTDEEVKNYAEWLGLDPKEDTDLMHLAKEGLKAPLKDGWKPCTNSDNEIFYFNFVTGQTSWTHPADEAYRTMVQEKKKSRGQAGVPVVHAPYSGVGHIPLEGQSAGVCGLARRILFCCRRRDLHPHAHAQ